MKFSVKAYSYGAALVPLMFLMPVIIGLSANPHTTNKLAMISVWSVLFSLMSLYFFLDAKYGFQSVESFAKHPEPTTLPLEFLNKIDPADESNVWAYYSFEERVLGVKMNKNADFHNFQLNSVDVINQFNNETMFIN